MNAWQNFTRGDRTRFIICTLTQSKKSCYKWVCRVCRPLLCREKNVCVWPCACCGVVCMILAIFSAVWLHRAHFCKTAVVCLQKHFNWAKILVQLHVFWCTTYQPNPKISVVLDVQKFLVLFIFHMGTSNWMHFVLSLGQGQVVCDCVSV